MGVPVEADPGQSLGKRSAGELLMSSESTVLGDGVGESQRVELDVGVTVYKALLDGSDAIAGAVRVDM